MWGKLHLICMKTKGFHAKIRCNLNDISYLSETQKNNFSVFMQIRCNFPHISYLSETQKNNFHFL